MASNLDVFKRIIFKVPSLKKTVFLIIGLGSIYGVSIFLTTKFFNSIQINNSIIVILPIFIFILPALVSGELYYRFLPNCSRQWSYFITLLNINTLLIYGLILSGINEFTIAWDVFWLAMVTIFLSSLIVLLFTFGYNYLKRIAPLCLVQPLIIVLSFHFYLGRHLNISILAYAGRTFVLGFAGAMILSAFLLAEYLIGSNLENISVLELSSGLIQKKQDILDLGQPVKPNVQTLSIKNEDDQARIAIPWIHPGPLEGFGGGRITSKVIENLNKYGKGFFFHVPSTHKSDPADPKDVDKILRALKDPELKDKASKMIKVEDEALTFYGRRIGDQKIIFMEEKDYGDYDIAIFQEIIDFEKTTVIDLHNHQKDKEPRKAVSLGSVYSEKIRKNLKELLDRLDDQEISSYEAGFNIDTTENPVISIVEKVGGQKTLILGIEDNGVSENLKKLSKKFESEFDMVILLTTDTHESIYKMISEESTDWGKVEKSVERANESISKGRIGFTNSKSEEMNLLMDDYLGLTYSINILIRLMPLSLGLLYFIVIIWML